MNVHSIQVILLLTGANEKRPDINARARTHAHTHTHTHTHTHQTQEDIHLKQKSIPFSLAPPPPQSSPAELTTGMLEVKLFLLTPISVITISSFSSPRRLYSESSPVCVSELAVIPEEQPNACQQLVKHVSS
jgi:hypothetical protein